MDATTKTPLSRALLKLGKFIESENIAEDLEQDELDRIGATVIEEFGIDERSNTEWAETANKAMDLALQVREAKSTPFPNASNVKWPLITVAALQFNARAYPEIAGTDGIVKARVVGSDPEGTKKAQASRISEHMSYQLSEEIENWEEDTDTLLMQLPIVGCAFRKVYQDTGANKPCSDLIPGIDLVVNKSTKSLSTAPRVTHKLTFYPQQIEERKRDGRWLDIDLGTATSGDGDKDAAHKFLEQHRWLDLDEDGYAEPYVVTLHQDSTKVVRIVANYRAEDVKQNGKKITRINKAEYFVKYGFFPDPKGGFYDIGFGRLLESIGAAIDTTINQMLDAGHLQNAGGGFIGSGVRFKKSHIRLEPGVYKTVEASGAKLREAIYNMEHPGPSSVLFNLLGLMIDAAKDITGVKDILVGDSGDRNQTATTTIALIEQGLKVFTAIYKRIYRALKKEFRLLYKLNAEYLDDEVYFNVLDTPKAIARTDYSEETYDVCPQADPKLVTDLQRAARAQLLMQFNQDPLVNQVEIRRRYFVANGIEDVEGLMVEQTPSPADMMGLAKGTADIEKTKAEANKLTAEADDKTQRRQMDAAKALLGLAQPAPAEPAPAA